MNNEITEERKIPEKLEAQEGLIHSIEKEIQESIKEKDETIQNLSQRLDDMQIRMQQEQEKLIEDLQNKQETKLKDLQREQDLIIDQLKKDQLKKEEEFQRIIEEKEKTIAELKNKIDDLKSIEENNSRQVKVIKNLKEQVDEKSKEIEEKEKQLEKAIEADEKLVGKIDDLKNDLKEKIEKITEKQNEIDNLNEKHKILQDEFDKIKTDYENVKNLKSGLIQGKENIISIMNNMLDNAKMRVLICTPTIENIKEIELDKLSKTVNVRIATFIDIKSEEHKEILDTYSGFPNITFRVFDKQDRWGLEHDREAIILAAHSKRFPMGMLSNDRNHIAFFSALLSEAWISGRPL
ncbi:MAG: hypothetical protein ACTSRG_13410 [Candidatus Helarchaeota archaeon]